jgi:hypothetical protein
MDHDTAHVMYRKPDAHSRSHSTALSAEENAFRDQDSLLCDSPSFILPKNKPSRPSSKFSLPWQTALYSSLHSSLSALAWHKSAAKNQIKNGTNSPPKSESSSIRPLPTPLPPPKGRPPTINTHDIEQYVQRSNCCMRTDGGFLGSYQTGNGIGEFARRL